MLPSALRRASSRGAITVSRSKPRRSAAGSDTTASTLRICRPGCPCPSASATSCISICGSQP